MFERLRLHKRVTDLEDRLTTAESHLKTMELEWSDTYDRLRRTMSRVVKRAEREAVDAAAEQVPDVSPVLTAGLTPRQRLIQSQIMQRRNHGGTDDGLLPR